MNVVLPEKPVDLYEVKAYYLWGNTVYEVRYVYHARRKSREVFPELGDRGSDLVDEWCFYDDGVFQCRYDGWSFVAEAKNWQGDVFFATRAEAQGALVTTLKVHVVDAERKLRALRDLLAKAEVEARMPSEPTQP